MQLGIFAKTFAAQGALSSLQAVATAGFETAQFNLACLGMPSMPEHIDPAVAADVAEAAVRTGISITAVSGTYNMIHPDITVRKAGLARLEVLCGVSHGMGTRLVTLCTGTRDPADQWRWHPANADADAWRDLLVEMEKAVAIAERFDLELGIEPELANVVSSAAAAAQLFKEMASPRLRIVLDPANLFEVATPEERHRLVEEAVGLLGPNITMAHAKDRSADGGFTAAGQGVIDFPHFVACLESAGFDGPLITHGLTEAKAPAVARFLKGVLERHASSRAAQEGGR
ncbi:sugar phosphate isomerase/epimerase family protein [Mesorhizobium sp. A623]